MSILRIGVFIFDYIFMKLILTLTGATLFALCLSCSKKEVDLYYPLTKDQSSFIAAAHTGDTLIWENAIGAKDTAIVQPIVYDSYVIDWGGNGHERIIGQRAYYLYRFLSTKKTKVADGIGVLAGDTSYTVVYQTGGTIAQTRTQLKLSTERINSTEYQDVYYYPFPLNDSLFFNRTGYLGHSYEGESLYRLK
jgi:hypothetical protein